MNETFKTELAAFARDIREICHASGYNGCAGCPLRFNNGTVKCAASGILGSHYNFDQVIAVVEDFRKRKKPCAEVIDRALDIYTIEVEVERGAVGATAPAKYFAKCAADELQHYFRLSAQPATVRVLSAKRFVLEGHKNDD